MNKPIKDLHTDTAKQIFKTEEVTPEQRKFAKRLNFGLTYGAGPRIQRRTVNIYNATKLQGYNPSPE